MKMDGCCVEWDGILVGLGGTCGWTTSCTTLGMRWIVNVRSQSFLLNHCVNLRPFVLNRMSSYCVTILRCASLEDQTRFVWQANALHLLTNPTAIHNRYGPSSVSVWFKLKLHLIQIEVAFDSNWSYVWIIMWSKASLITCQRAWDWELQRLRISVMLASTEHMVHTKNALWAVECSVASLPCSSAFWG